MYPNCPLTQNHSLQPQPFSFTSQQHRHALRESGSIRTLLLLLLFEAEGSSQGWYVGSHVTPVDDPQHWLVANHDSSLPERTAWHGCRGCMEGEGEGRGVVVDSKMASVLSEGVA